VPRPETPSDFPVLRLLIAQWTSWASI